MNFVAILFLSPSEVLSRVEIPQEKRDAERDEFTVSQAIGCECVNCRSCDNSCNVSCNR